MLRTCSTNLQYELDERWHCIQLMLLNWLQLAHSIHSRHILRGHINTRCEMCGQCLLAGTHMTASLLT